MRVMALDVGQRRIGVALSDPTGTLAHALMVIDRRSKREDSAAIQELVTLHDVGVIVVGYPRNMNGTAGPQAEAVARFAAALERAVSVPLVFWDERLTTRRAEQLMHEAAHRPPKVRHWADAVAAAVILQEFLDAGGAKGLSSTTERGGDP
ncbi:MAG: Holliday junction resolvase RuvX [Chloroflexi bacterium]|nr:Holliday junction resolvase RuvX [Chloroflexota bacterium]